MSFFTYKIIHYVGIFLLMFSLGSIFTKYTKAAAIGHGVALLIMLVAGFGMQARMKEPYAASYGSAWPNWLIAKIVIWLIFGGVLVLAKRKIIKAQEAMVILPLLAGGAAYLAIFKPF